MTLLGLGFIFLDLPTVIKPGSCNVSIGNIRGSDIPRGSNFLSFRKLGVLYSKGLKIRLRDFTVLKIWSTFGRMGDIFGTKLN